MPREITIARPDREPLGDASSVRHEPEATLPGVRFFLDPSGLKKMDAAGVGFPEVLRRHLTNAPATTQAGYKVEGNSIRFFLGAGSGVERMDGKVRGGGDPRPVLSRLAEINGWVILGPDGIRVVW